MVEGLREGMAASGVRAEEVSALKGNASESLTQQLTMAQRMSDFRAREDHSFEASWDSVILLGCYHFQHVVTRLVPTYIFDILPSFTL